MSGEAIATSTLSSYEQSRARNIERNNKLLRELGLISVQEEKASNNEAWGLTTHRVVKSTDITRDNNENHDGEDENWSPAAKNKNKKKRKNQNTTRTSPVRKSARILGIDPDGGELFFDDADRLVRPLSQSQEERRRQRQAIVEECREARQRAALRVMEAGAEKAAQENPTGMF